MRMIPLFQVPEIGGETVSDDLQELARVVQATRKRKGLTLEQVAKRGGPSVAWLSSLESGRMFDRPKMQTLKRLADALDVSLPILLDIVGFGELVGKSASSQPSGNHGPAMVLGVVANGDDGQNHGAEPISGESSVVSEGILGPGGQLEPRRDLLKLPLLGVAACGDPIYATMEHVTEYIEVSRDEANGADAAFTIRGDSMSAEFLRDGDRVLVKMLDGARPESGKVVIVRTPDGLVAKRYRCDDLGEYLEEQEYGQPARRLRFEEGSLVAVCVAHYRKM
jgi:SOS-response transcriptional repressor LexA